MYDLVVRGGLVVGPDGSKEANIAVQDGKIKVVGAPGTALAGREVVNATDRLVLPGLVDAHVHIPGYMLTSRLDDFHCATKAAAAGGITTVMLMPTDDPRTVTPEYFHRKREIGERESFVDFAIQAMVSPRSERCEIEEMAALGAVSFEVFLAYGGNPEFIIGDEDYELHRLMEHIGGVDGIAGVTPHSGPLIARLTQEQKRLQRNRRYRESTAREIIPPIVQWFVMTRPALSEGLGITRACTVAVETGTKTHIRALSARRSIDHVRRFDRDAQISTEVMSHHLMFTEQEAFDLGPYGVIVPPVRPKAERDALRTAIRKGEIDMVVSDHSPVLMEDKERGWEDIWRTPPGMPGVQTMLPSMLVLVDQGVITIGDVVRLCCREPAVKFGLHPQKGELIAGADADLVVLDPTRKTTIDNSEQYSRARYTTMKGQSFNSRIESVYLRGRRIVHESVIEGGPWGHFTRPSLLARCHVS